MIEFLKCVLTGLAVFTVLGLLLWGYSHVDLYIAKELPYLFPGVFAFAMAAWLGTIIRGDAL